MAFDTPIDRSTFLRQASGFVLASVLPVGLRLPTDPARSREHPEPREGITSERVLSVEALEKFSKRKRVMEAFEYARAYPALFDGIACGCSCGSKSGTHRSLLVCYESLQPTGCGECQEEGELVGKMAKESRTLAEIREAIDRLG